MAEMIEALPNNVRRIIQQACCWDVAVAVGHSRSLETEPLHRSYTTYYYWSYLTLNIIVTLKCRLEVTQGH